MSSLVKANIKIGTANDIGVHLDDVLTAAENDVHRCDGAGVEAMRIGAHLEALFAGVQREIDSGKIDMLTGTAVIDGIKRSCSVVSDHITRAAHAKTLAQGRVHGCKEAVAFVVKFKTDEENKVRAILEAAARENVPPEDLGPKPTIKQQRAEEDRLDRREEEAKKTKKAGRNAKNA